MSIKDLLQFRTKTTPTSKKRGVAKKKAAQKVNSGGDTETTRRWTRSSVRHSIASHMEKMESESDAVVRPAGRGESLFSINGSPVAAENDRGQIDDHSNDRLSRRITLKGLNDDIELLCVLPTQDASAAGSKVAIEALEKEELVKMRDALQKAKEQADLLLLQFGI